MDHTLPGSRQACGYTFSTGYRWRDSRGPSCGSLIDVSSSPVFTEPYKHCHSLGYCVCPIVFLPCFFRKTPRNLDGSLYKLRRVGVYTINWEQRTEAMVFPFSIWSDGGNDCISQRSCRYFHSMSSSFSAEPCGLRTDSSL